MTAGSGGASLEIPFPLLDTWCTFSTWLHSHLDIACHKISISNLFGAATNQPAARRVSALCYFVLRHVAQRMAGTLHGTCLGGQLCYHTGAMDKD